ncbi:MAG: asparaginase [Fusobacterium sp.]|nr:asparaginase [Fusobacterium sp.]
MQNQQQPTTLTRHIRDGLLEEQHFGFITRVGRSGVLETFGDTKGEPFYLRSCAKPLQASVIVDYELPLTEQEIALACGSNAGEKCHYETARGFAEKFGIRAEDLRCGVHKPLSKTSQAEIKEADVFHNNCVGKHLTMLALCKKLGFSTENYDALEHPVQQLIIKKVNELCEVTTVYPITKDGCGVPILSMPLENMVRGFLNLFCNEKYSPLTQAILNNPYIFGGEDRTDTKIVQTSGLICKVGAGGLCIVVNRQLQEGFVVKVSDCDMKARELVVIDYINRLNWGKIAAERSIKTLHGEIIGEIQVNV